MLRDVLLTKRCRVRQITSLEAVMDAKWNDLVDNTMVRIGLVVIGFGAWLAIGYGLLAA